jgi:hypothetical protein
MFGDRVIDVLKIDAEQVDAKVLAGASRLLKENHIRVIMWETPNDFPITTFLDWFGGAVGSFGALISELDQYAGMTCYFPGSKNKMIKITGCWESLMEAPVCKNSNCP